MTTSLKAHEKQDADHARHAVKLLIEDLTGRKGLRHEWERIEAPIVREIKTAWRAIIRRDIRLAIEQERARCLAVVQEIAQIEGAKYDDACPWGDAEYQIAHPDETGEPMEGESKP